MTGTYKENMTFEADVRRVAEAVWSLAPGECQPTHYPNDPVVRELDGIARLRDVTHLMMVTTSTKLLKVKDDVKKLISAEVMERKNAAAVSKWLITQTQLDAEHIEFARKSNVIALTLEQFQRRFFDSAKYLGFRNKNAFGSARDPVTDSINIAEDAYVALPMEIAVESNLSSTKSRNKSITLQQIAQRVLSGEVVVLRAPFGSGKSLTGRELFRYLANLHRNNPSSPVPLALNLREHWGEDHGDEILERHARSIGYSPREDLVVAWRSAMCSLLLDGFDEVAAQTVVRTDNVNFMREARRRALQGLRDFTKKLPKGVGVFICGRDHYFDNVIELESSLGISGQSYAIVDLEEFSDESANQFLLKNKISARLPDWLPRKPLLLSYLLRANLFASILEIDSSKGFGHAWDSFLRRICEREAGLENSSMDAETLRAVLERLADSVRSKSSGTGPITGNDLADAYTLETAQSAGEGVLAQLQRLPGLTQRDSEPGTRSFVDYDMLGALQGGAFARQVLTGFLNASLVPLSELSEKAVAMAGFVLREKQATPETLIGVAEQLQHRAQKDRVAPQLIADCVSVAIQMAIDMERDAIDFRGLLVDGASLGAISMEEICVAGIEFRNCSVREITFGDMSNSTGTFFSNCLITKVSGASNRAGLPQKIISEDCEIEAFDNIGTTRAVLQLPIDPRLKALITILRKLYRQAGAGRKFGAFNRGITRPEVLEYVEPVLDILQKNQFISIFNAVVHPVRKQTSRVERILSSPTLSEDKVVIETKALP